VSIDLSMMKQTNPFEDEDTDSITEESSAGSVSSEDSFSPRFAISTIRYAVFGKVKSSAQGLARKSKAKLSPVLRRSSNAIVFGPRSKRRRTPLTPQQKERRRRRRDNATKIRRMLQRVNQDPFVASRVIQAFSVLFLLLGDRLLAACTSFISVLILHQTTQLASTKALQVWYYVGVISLAISVGSKMSLSVFEQSSVGILPSVAKLQDAGWLWGQAAPRLWGVFLALWLYQDIESSKDGNDNAIDTIEIEISLHRAQCSKAESTSTYRQWKNAVVTVHHGPMVLGSIDMRRLLEEGSTTMLDCQTFQSTSFSHFIESSKGSSLQCHVAKRNGEAEETLLLGTAKVPVPTTSDLKMSNWFPIVDSKNNQRQGELMVKIESRQSARNFLFRATTVLPTLACFALAAWCRT
jgi:hypothetical protein